jgi:MYXO-CTERM domain-containing protein
MSRPRLIASLLLPLALSCEAARESSAPPRLETHAAAIRNGQRDPRITPMTAGQVMSIGYLHGPGSADSAFCTGTVIAPRVVVTARHCTQGVTAAEIGFGVGVVPAEAVADFAVESVVEHPEQDVSLLILTRPATLDVPGLVPLDFNRQPLGDADVGHQVEAAGFGETLDPTRVGRYFALVMLSAVDDTYVLVDGQQREGLCFGDSGGPVLGLDALGHPSVLGVEHGGEESCVGRDQLTRLDRVQAWIDGVVQSLPAEQSCGAESYAGHCEGDVAVWCHENGQLARLDCAAEGRICAYVDAETGYYCKTRDNCAAELTGCSGEVRIFCINGVVAQEDCAALGGLCTQDAGGPLCVDLNGVPLADPPAPPPDDPFAEGPDAGLVDDGADSPAKFAGNRACQSAPGQTGPRGAVLGGLVLAGLGLRRRRRSAQG